MTTTTADSLGVPASTSPAQRGKTFLSQEAEAFEDKIATSTGWAAINQPQVFPLAFLKCATTILFEFRFMR